MHQIDALFYQCPEFKQFQLRIDTEKSFQHEKESVIPNVESLNCYFDMHRFCSDMHHFCSDMHHFYF